MTSSLASATAPALPSAGGADPAAARQVAAILLEIGAVTFRPAEPYRLTAGWASPVYIDVRRLIAFPRARRRVMDLATRHIERTIGLEGLDMVAGGETAGIPYAAWLAESLMLPMAYVRKQPKGFGRMARIEGALSEGQRVLLVEDLATDGGSKLSFVEGLRDAGAQVGHAFVVFFYSAFPGALDSLERAGVRLHWLATWADVLAVAEEWRAFPESDLAGVRAFLADPIGWSAAHGGKG